MAKTGKLTTSERAQDARLRRIYKKTLADKRREIGEQNGGCAICGRPYPKYILNQDHDHKCCNPPRGKKNRAKATFCGKCCRGWVCYLCNRWALGSLEYMAKVQIDPEKAIAYLKKWELILKARGCYESKKEKS
jgi:hypothetical protein